MMEDTRDIAQLIRKHLEGTLAPEEQARLARWTDSAPENRAYFERIASGDALVEDLQELHQLLGEEQTPWPEVLVARLREDIGGAPSRTIGRTQRLRRWLPYAAAVAILALAVGAWLAISLQQSAVSIAATEILPGGNKATLTLADGRVINLDEAQTGIVIGDENITYADGSNLELSHLEGGRGVTETTELLSLTTPKGGTYQVTLPDGSKVWLNAASTLKYPSRFSGNSREVILQGEAYFDIEPVLSPAGGGRDGKSVGRGRLPFLVKTSNQTIEVLGTQFNISAYADEPETKTTLVEGKVKVTPGTEKGSTQAGLPDFRTSGLSDHVLTPGQQATTRGAATTIQEVDVNQFIAWKDGKFIFTGKPFGQVMAELARWYDLDVVYDSSVPDITFFGGIHRNNNLSAVLKVLESAQINYTVQSGKRLVIHHNTNGKEVTR